VPIDKLGPCRLRESPDHAVAGDAWVGGKLGPVSDPWEDEGFADEDDWEGGESVQADLEDEPEPVDEEAPGEDEE
jgi:hypothetical protein